jgi:TolB protein
MFKKTVLTLAAALIAACSSAPRSAPPAGTEIIAYVEVGEHCGIVFARPNGTPAGRMPSGPWHDVEPALSPDGQRVAFSSNRDGNWEIYVGKLGEAARRMTSDPRWDGQPCWSPDGKALYFAAQDGEDWNIYSLDIASGKSQPVVKGPKNEAQPMCSPDGRSLAYVSDEHGNWDLFVRDLASGQSRRLTDHAEYDCHPCWSPDGRTLAFMSHRSGTEAIHLIDAAGGEPRMALRADGQDFLMPRFSPDGSKLAAVRKLPDDRCDIVCYDLNSKRLWALTSNGSAAGPSWGK